MCLSMNCTTFSIYSPFVCISLSSWSPDLTLMFSVNILLLSILFSIYTNHARDYYCLQWWIYTEIQQHLNDSHQPNITINLYVDSIYWVSKLLVLLNVVNIRVCLKSELYIAHLHERVSTEYVKWLLTLFICITVIKLYSGNVFRNLKLRGYICFQLWYL